MAYIQLSFGVKYNNKKNQLNIPSNYKSDVLFSQLPYLAHVDHSVFKQRVEDILKYEKSVQKFLLATGDLNDSIQQGLNLLLVIY